MPENGDVRVGRSLVIPEGELEFKFTTSGGPGGQHANKTATRVEIIWNIDRSTVLGPRRRATIRRRLGRRVDASGNLRLASDRYRSQTRNRDDVRRRLAEMIAAALKPRARRIPTAPTAGATTRRLAAKRRRSEIKRARRVPDDDA